MKFCLPTKIIGDAKTILLIVWVNSLICKSISFFSLSLGLLMNSVLHVSECLQVGFEGIY